MNNTRCASRRPGIVPSVTPWVTAALLMLCVSSPAFDAFITMQDGYFYDPAAGAAWVPHGIAYQTWNRPLGVWQTHEQIDYDLDEMKKMGANSIRVDFVWQHIEEDGDNQFAWDNYDYLVQAAEARDIRIFALIGYQWPPNWFPDEWYTMHPPEYDAGGIYHPTRWLSDIINYNHPQARLQYAEWFQNVCGRYKDAKAIVAWIIGNESGYLGLWSGLLDGYDPESEQAFRDWCQARYTNIAAANAVWGTAYTNFNQLSFPDQYRAYGVEGAVWADAVQWREDSIGSFTAVGAVAAKAADTNHLISYSTVGMQWGEEDWRYHAEDRGKITDACLASNAPIDFFSVNNYPWSILGHESQNGHWGVSYTKKVAKVPVLYSETGFTSSETMWPGMNELRQGPLIRNALWESLEAGAIGTHIFAWHDRPYITDREKGFGILYADRVIKPAYWVSRDTFTLMEQSDLRRYLAGSEDPAPDIAFLWTAANDSQYNRYECEMQQIAGALERLGYEPNFIDLADLGAGAYTNFEAVFLPRNMRVDRVVPGSGGKGVLEFLRTVVISQGVHVVATGDLPGLQDPNGNAMTNFVDELEALFGVDASDTGGFEVPQRTKEYVSWYWAPIDVRFTTNALGPLSSSYAYRPYTWKYSDEIVVTNGGVVWAEMDSRRNKGFEMGPYSSTNLPEWDGVWGTFTNEDHWGWTMDGTNMLHLWGDSGLWQDVPVLPFGRYTFSSYLRSNHDDPLRGGACASLSIEWYDKGWTNLGTNVSAVLTAATPGDAWVRCELDVIAPSNAWTARRLIRCGSVTNAPNLLLNGGLSGSGTAPTSWTAWNEDNHDPDAGTYHDATPSWAFWWDSGIWQDVTSGFVGGDTMKFGGYLYTPSWDALRDGDKHGEIALEVYSNATLMTTYYALPTVSTGSTSNVWIYTEGTGAVPAGATTLRLLVQCAGSSGDGRFLADDVFLVGADPGGAVFVDNRQWAPAVVAKDHGAAKAVIFLYGAGDNKPDGDEDTQPDILLWQYRYDIFGAMVSNYLGITPALKLSGTNAYLCLAEYRTCTNGAVLMQVKNYLYDTNYADGGADMTYTITSPMFVGKTLRAFDQCRLLETNSDGTFSITLPPDGQDMIVAEAPAANEIVIQIANTPSIMHPFGDQCYGLTVKYDTAGKTGLVLKIAFMENGDNGDGTPDEIYQVLWTNVPPGSGENTFWMWIPDPDQNDTDYISTPEGGSYIFKAWLEDGSSNVWGETLPRETALEWGIVPTTPVPLDISKGDTTNITVKWEDLHEQLFWQNTPLERGAAFPVRVAVYRSTKTQQFYPDHFDRVNRVCDWLASLGYAPANRQDVSFDNVWVVPAGGTNDDGACTLFQDDMESGTNGWAADGLWHQDRDLCDSPSNSWAYSDGTDYDTGARNFGSLVTPWITLSNAEAGASVVFRSWHETEAGGPTWDRKRVYVSTNGTAWVDVLHVTGTNGLWSSCAADLTPWAGQAVKIRFHFDTIDALYNAFRGWRIDDVRVIARTAPREDLFFDDMESTTNWTGDGLWRTATNRSTSGTNSWVYNNGANYATGARTVGALLSPWIDLSQAADATLTFRSWYRTEDEGTTWDRKLIYATANGTNWARILQVAGPAEAWTAPSYDLAAYGGGPVRLKFQFDSIDALNNAYEGWYIDDVRISSLSGSGAAAFADGAEEGTNDWSVGGLWHQAGDRYAGGARSWAYNDGADYDTGGRNSGALVTRWIDLTAAAGATLEFKSWYETEDAGTSWDRKLVYLTTNDTDWIQLRQVSGPSRQWVATTVGLTAYAGSRVRLKFFFDTMDPLYNGYQGWYLDDITVRLVGSGFAFLDTFDGPGAGTNWSRVAGAANWAVTNSALRAWRIGNDDNLLCAGDADWSNYVASVDLRYNTQGPYFNDAELYVRYQDRDNCVKVGLRDFYGFWRLRYMVRQDTNFVAQNWIHTFSKTNRPVEDRWYNLKVRAETNEFTVFFDGEEVGSFTATNFPTGRIAVGSMATQLGIWEPAKGYYFIDDDEYAFWSPVEGQIVTLGSPLNLDWGYLTRFFPMLILPSVYVMNDAEAANVSVWITNGFYSLMATDGGVARRDETGADDPGRVEDVFGVGTGLDDVTGLARVEIGTNVHYATLDYAPDASVDLAGDAAAWRGTGQATALGTLFTGSTSAPALICNVITQKAASPPKTFCFNYAVDTGGQLTNDSALLAQRAFEWLQGQTYRLTVELKYVLIPTNPNLDVVVFSTNFWTLNGWGTNDLTIEIPMDNCMTGTNLYWVMYTYPWDATNAWSTHKGFYSAANEGIFTTLDGFGLQVLGITDQAFAGRDWDMWVAYNTQGSNLVAHFGVKDRGTLALEDNFNDGDTSGWTVTPSTNIAWAGTNGALRATVIGAGGYAWITRDDLSATGQNLTVEYRVRFLGDATNSGDGGLLYRGVPLCITPRACGWRDAVTNLFTNNLPATGAWNRVMFSVRDGAPYPRSDLYVDGNGVFLDEPIEATNWDAAGIALLSPYYGGSVEWDNFRVADEEYSLTTQAVSGVFSPTTEANFWPSLPDYDPGQWEFDGTTLGGRYSWYIYFEGEGVHGYHNGGVYFAPRLMVENTNFPADMTAGDTVQVPIDWEDLGTNQPCTLFLHLENPFAGETYTTNAYLVTHSTGSGWFEVDVPLDIPAAGDYSWSAYLSPTNATNTWVQRIGSDDSFRFDAHGVAVEPETIIWVRACSATGFACYSDLGIPEPGDMAFFTWGGLHDGDYTNIGAPEGTKCWMTDLAGGTYAGWGVFHTNGYKDMSAYSNLVFWVKTEESSVKIQVEAPAGVQRTRYLDQLGWDASKAGQWQELSVPITNFGFASSPTNVYGSFLATLEFLPTRYAFQFVNTQNVWMVGLPGSSHGIHMKQSTNGGASWMGRSAGTNYAGTGFYDIDMVDGTNGWIVGGYNNVMATTNAGVTWELRTNGLRGGQYWYNVDFINSQTGWVCGQYDVARTTDGGLNWTNTFTASNYVRSIQFLDADNGWASGYNFMLRTTNGGVSWAYTFIPVTNATYWRDVYFVNSSTGWACGYYGRIGKTEDGGDTWALVTNSPAAYNQYLYGMTWATENDGWIVGSGTVESNMFFTHDGGATWSACYSAASNTLLDVEFLNPNVGFAGGSAGWTVMTTNGLAATPTWTDNLPGARTFYIDNVRWTVTP